MKCATSIFFSASLIASVMAHGWVGTLTIAGKAYKGNQPLEQAPNGAPSVVRQISDNLPVKDVSLPDLTCGRNAKPAALVAPATPGDILLTDWNTLAGDGNWFHNMGPILTYLARCESNCAEFNASEGRWFKIAEQGPDANGNWAQAKLEEGSPARAALPANLKAGQYLLRNEIIALHTAQSIGGAEFYIGCSQISITGYGMGEPTESELVRFPGAYHSTDKGILIDVYNMKGAYQFPGPPVAGFVNGGSSQPSSPHSSSENATHTSTHPGTQSATKAVAPTTTATKTCKSKRKPSPDAPVVDLRRSRMHHAGVSL
ncbi:glycoside hydrolase family 61 protein [Mycena sanguinolenta]|nr:glycoside hydrolase family 61 protein [Mycena sanguinolenta]